MPTVYYWSGLSQANQDLLSAYPDALAKVSQLSQGHTREADLDLKRHGEYLLYTIRLNQADRLLFTTIERDGKQYILLLEVIENHDYQKSRFLKSGVLRNYLNTHDADIAAVTSTEAFVEGSDTAPLFDTTEEAPDVDTQPVMRYQDRWLGLDMAQQAASTASEYPLLVSGPPGSGKSCVALSLLVQAIRSRAPDETGRLLCVTESSHVALHLRRQWQDLPEALDEAGNVRDDVRFLTYKQLLCEMLHVDASLFVDESYFQIWYTGYQQSVRRPSLQKKEASTDQFPDAALIYQECRIISGCEALAQYQALGQAQSLFSEGEARSHVWAIFQAYQAHLEHEQRIAPDFQRMDVAPQFSHIVVDEAQDLSPRQLANLNELVTHNRLACAMDSNQNLMSRVPIRLLLQQYCFSRGLTLHEVPLEGTYRCPEHIVTLANGVLAVKNAVMGGTSDRGELSSITQAVSDIEQGTVNWEEPPQNAAHFQAKLAALRASHGLKATEVAIITPAAYVETVQTLTGHALVFTPEGIKGLEYPCIIAYNPLHCPTFRQASAQLPDIAEGPLHVSPHRVKNKANDAMHCAPDFNGVFVAFTRATQVLVVMQEESHTLRHLIGHLKSFVSTPVQPDDAESKEAETEAPETTLEDYQTEVARLWENNNKPEAANLYNQHLREALGQSFNDYCVNTFGSAESKNGATQKQASPANKQQQTQPRRNQSKKSNGRRRRFASQKKPPSPPSKAAAVSDEAYLALLTAIGQPELATFEGARGQVLLQALCKTDSTLVVRLILALSQQPDLQDTFFDLVSPFFQDEVEGVSGVKYSQYLVVKLSGLKSFNGLWERFRRHMTPDVLSASINGVDGIMDGSSVLYYLCKNRFDLVRQRALEILPMFTKQSLNRPITEVCDDQGMTPLYQLTCSLERIEVLQSHYHRIKAYISTAGLAQPVTAPGESQGKSPFYCICRYDLSRTGVLLDTLFRGYKVTSEGLCQLVTAEGPEKGMSALYLLVSSNAAEEGYLVNYYRDLVRLITPKALNQTVVDADGVTGFSVLYYLTATYYGQKLFKDYAEEVKQLIRTEGLCTPIVGRHVDAGKSVLYHLCKSDWGIRFLTAAWDEIKDKITSDAFLRTPAGITCPLMDSPFFHLYTTVDGQEFLLKHWVDIQTLIPPRTLGQADACNETALWHFSRNYDGRLLLLEHWDTFHITWEDFHRITNDQSEDAGMTMLHHLCCHTSGQDVLRQHWDKIKPWLDRSLFTDDITIPQGFHKGKTLTWALCESPDGKRHRDFFRQALAELPESVTGEEAATSAALQEEGKEGDGEVRVSGSDLWASADGDGAGDQTSALNIALNVMEHSYMMKDR